MNLAVETVSDKPKLEKPLERIARSWKLALEFGADYPIGRSERAKLLDHGALRRVVER